MVMFILYYLYSNIKPCLSLFNGDTPVCVRSGYPAIKYKTAHAYRLGTFQLIRQWLYAFPLQLHNHADSH